ncbi:hypothetical protein C1I92_25225 [Jiangella anatolica]|uniref:Uncharacterized protein n=1 Tax=Jiangella anatolica TaxID=2670374 RepID=A0A2W2C4B1_9ACTN|nr:hypothetical protein C1I92_25225 [Jiangella anatolica]
MRRPRPRGRRRAPSLRRRPAGRWPRPGRAAGRGRAAGTGSCGAWDLVSSGRGPTARRGWRAAGSPRRGIAVCPPFRTAPFVAIGRITHLCAPHPSPIASGEGAAVSEGLPAFPFGGLGVLGGPGLVGVVGVERIGDVHEVTVGQATTLSRVGESPIFRRDGDRERRPRGHAELAHR